MKTDIPIRLSRTVSSALAMVPGAKLSDMSFMSASSSRATVAKGPISQRSEQSKRVGPNVYRDRESWARFSRPGDAAGAQALVRVVLGK